MDRDPLNYETPPKPRFTRDVTIAVSLALAFLAVLLFAGLRHIYLHYGFWTE